MNKQFKANQEEAKLIYLNKPSYQKKQVKEFLGNSGYIGSTLVPYQLAT